MNDRSDYCIRVACVDFFAALRIAAVSVYLALSCDSIVSVVVEPLVKNNYVSDIYNLVVVNVTVENIANRCICCSCCAA